MSKQRFKSVYLTDYPSSSANGRHLSLAFGTGDQDLFEATRRRSAEDLRVLLGSDRFTELAAAADQAGETLNAFCLKRLREQLSLDLSYDAAAGVQEPLQDGLASVFASHRGGAGEPLHDWFPYLEGYSSRFVRTVIERYAPAARVVLDPFSGTGTTPITCASQGLMAYYAEVNPLLQFLTEVKLDVMCLGGRALDHLAQQLESEAQRLANDLDGMAPDETLIASYRAIFGASEFFDDETLVRVLQFRRWADDLAGQDDVLARAVEVAVAACLVPSSRLIRAGDLRFKTDVEARRESVPLATAVANHLTRMALDARRLRGVVVRHRPILIAEDARNLASLPGLEIDAVVTSPPYLNGTNYFRNTKLELWFLRALKTSDDLAEYRTRSVTAGINDVSSRRRLGEVLPSVARLVDRISDQAYDPRIPKMIHSYFQDMATTMTGIVAQLAPEAVLAIDIGDSAYGGVHVPTDRLLVELMAEHGQHLVDEVVLRRRRSRGGHVLRQVLLVFRPGGYRSVSKDTGEPWRSRWEGFKSALPHQQGEFAKRNWGHPLHSLCSYQGKMKPSLASHLVQTFVPDGGSMLDPFAGVATIPFEAAVHGRRAYGFDISPAAVVIGTAKLGNADRQQIRTILDALAGAIESGEIADEEREEAHRLGFNGKLDEYFHPGTLREVLLARRYFRAHPPHAPAAALVAASLLHILHGNRPYALSRRSHPITPFAPTGEFEYRPLLPRLTAKVERSLAVDRPPTFVAGEMIFQDATSWWPSHVAKLDAVVTSPPFFGSTRFHLANWMRLWFAGWGSAEFRSRPLAFVDERQKHDFRVYEHVFRQARERLKPGGVVVLHLGKSKKCDMADSLSRVAAPWFRVADRFVESVEHCESHGIRDKGTVQDHQYLVLS